MVKRRIMRWSLKVTGGNEGWTTTGKGSKRRCKIPRVGKCLPAWVRTLFRAKEKERLCHESKKEADLVWQNKQKHILQRPATHVPTGIPDPRGASNGATMYHIPTGTSYQTADFKRAGLVQTFPPSSGASCETLPPCMPINKTSTDPVEELSMVSQGRTHGFKTGEDFDAFKLGPGSIRRPLLAVAEKRDLAQDEKELASAMTRLELKACKSRVAQKKVLAEISMLEEQGVEADDQALVELQHANAEVMDEQSSIEAQQDGADDALRELHERAYRVHCTFMDHFDDMLVSEGLIEPLESPPPPNMADDMPSSPPAQYPLRHKEGLQTLRSMRSSDEELEAQQKEFLFKYEHARRRLRDYEQELYDRSNQAWDQLQKRLHKIALGDEVESERAFAVRQFLDTQNATRKVISAEEVYFATKAAAVEAGMKPGSEVESGFAEYSDDGYALSAEPEQIESVNPASIDKWLSCIPRAFDVLQPLEQNPLMDMLSDSGASALLDNWDAESVSVWETWSNKADRDSRRRIDTWRKTTEALYHSADGCSVAGLQEDAEVGVWEDALAEGELAAKEAILQRPVEAGQDAAMEKLGAEVKHNSV